MVWLRSHSHRSLTHNHQNPPLPIVHSYIIEKHTHALALCFHFTCPCSSPSDRFQPWKLSPTHQSPNPKKYIHPCLFSAKTETPVTLNAPNNIPTTMTMELTSKPPETEATPPPLLSRPKPLSFSNGSLKRHHHPPPPPPPRAHYRECLKNHAAALGGHALDGCCEFMPSPNSNPSDPTSLKCAACGCHRNFHRRDDDDEDNEVDDTDYLPHPIQLPPKRQNSHSPPPYLSSSAPHMLLALSTGYSVPADTGNPHPTTPGTNRSSSSSGVRKRFRTKFSKEQKERMHAFSEKLGWRMQRQDEESVDEFCKEIGVSKGVFKVWMHNNKNTFVKRELSNSNRDVNTTSIITSNSNVDITDNDAARSSNAHLTVNGSSSSS